MIIDFIKTINWANILEYLKIVGAVGGILFLLYFVYQRIHAVCNWLFPLKITVFGTAYCEYHDELREYIVIVREVEVHVRRPITTKKARCIQIGDDKNCYPSAEARLRASETWEKSGVHNMRFAPEIYDEDDMPEDLRNEGVTKGRIILGRWKSRWFPITRINVIREGDIVISK